MSGPGWPGPGPGPARPWAALALGHLGPGPLPPRANLFGYYARYSLHAFGLSAYL